MTIPFWPVLGGALIGLSALLLMGTIGRIAGVSGIFWGAWAGDKNHRLWRWMFVAGIVIGTFMFHWMSDRPYPQIHENFPLAILAGLIVGIGVKLGSGCTSGHGVCGMSRLSLRSIVATGVFMSVAIVVVTATNILL